MVHGTGMLIQRIIRRILGVYAVPCKDAKEIEPHSGKGIADGKAMQIFRLRPTVHEFTSAADFAAEFQIGERDLILTHQFLHTAYFEPLGLPAHTIFLEKYGTGEPTDTLMYSVLQEMKRLPIDRIIAVGGGTVLDTAKILTLRGLERIEDAFERRIPLQRDKGLVAVPTTCGTGSEVTNIAITEFTVREIKLGLADDTLFPDHAVLIPELLRDLPYPFYLFSSIDALIHATESWVSPKSNVMTQMFSREAIRLILDIYGKLATDGEAYRFERLSDILRASTAAGIAFGNTGVGAVHALSYPLGGKYHVPHGESNYLFFTTIFRHYQSRNPNGKIHDLNQFLADCLNCPESAVYEQLENLLGRLIIRNPLRHYGMQESEVETFADSVLEKQQRLLANNYVPLSREEIRTLYRTLY